jgi:head-tail adaptor
VQLHGVPETIDDYGSAGSTGPLIGEFWAYITNPSGREQTAAQQTNAVATHRVEMGWLGTAIPATAGNPNRLVLPGMYLVHVRTGRRFDIVFANNENEGNYKWILTCSEIVSSG